MIFVMLQQKFVENSGQLPTECGAMETFHIDYVLEQFCKGYICATNDKEWDTHEFKHVFHDKDNAGNVLVTFFRFEYQSRSCIHLHMLVWLRSLSKINLNLHSATIPQDDKEMTFLLLLLQQSDRRSKFLKEIEEENHIDDKGNVI